MEMSSGHVHCELVMASTIVRETDKDKGDDMENAIGRNVISGNVDCYQLRSGIEKSHLI